MSRAWTQEEVREKFLVHCWECLEYWAHEVREPTIRGKLQGLLHSFLCMLDGVAADIPAFEVIPTPHPDDKKYCEENGYNYYQPVSLPPDIMTVHGSEMLHELMYNIGRKLGYVK